MSPASATAPKLFVSHSSADTGWAEDIHRLLDEHGYGVFLDSHPDDGIRVGEEWERTLWLRLRQSSGVIVLCSPNWLRSPWCVAEALIARERGKTIFVLVAAAVRDTDATRLPLPDAQPSVPRFLRNVQFLRLSGRPGHEVEQRLLRGIEQSIQPERQAVRQPYRGLEPYEEQDAGVFFGRDQEKDELIRILKRRRLGNAHGFIVVLGASGTGKSSLVRAGILPRLKGEDGGAAWLVGTPIHAADALEGLARSLAGLSHSPENPATLQSVRERLNNCFVQQHVRTRPLHDAVSEILLANHRTEAHLVLVLDQLEEVFRGPGKAGAAVLGLLLTACSDHGSRLVVIATMRSDSLTLFQLLPAAAGRYEQMTLDPMPRSRFAEVISGPANVVSLELEPGLTEALIEDTQYSDALPLLAYALRELYESFGEDGDITLEEYRRRFPPVSVPDIDGKPTTIQGVSAAVKTVADQILLEEGYRGLPSADPRLRDLRNAALRLADYSAGEPHRATARWADMPRSCERVLRRFVRERLLVSGVDSSGAETLSVSHEALFRVWDRFQQWLAESRDVLALRTQLKRATIEWDEAGRSRDLRWTDDRVVDAVQRLCSGGIACPEHNQESVHPFTPLERRFLGPLTPSEIAQRLEEPGLELTDRARMGVRLALIGDDRPGVSLDAAGFPEIAWVRITGGEVSLRDPRPEEWAPLAEELSRLTGGSVPDPASHARKRRLHEAGRSQHVPSFEMGKYMVTWIQLQAFRSAPDFDDERWWGGWPAAPGATQPVLGNHPATHLTWYEARAFCRWLTAHRGDGKAVRLPTEQEWQLAATGGDPSRLYPWGNQLSDPPYDYFEYANTFEGRNRAQSHLMPTTTAVGVFPLGTSPNGVMDLSGNAWEWCESVFDPQAGDGTHSARAVRGGSWVIGLPACTTVYCGQLDPSSDNYFVGFRVVRSAIPDWDQSHRVSGTAAGDRG